MLVKKGEKPRFHPARSTLSLRSYARIKPVDLNMSFARYVLRKKRMLLGR